MLFSPDLAEWARLLRSVRKFFDDRGFLEVMTDHVVPAGAFESSIDPLRVSHSGGTGELHTSPEIEMKRLLARSGRSIYQICRCFRDDPPTPVHRREFTMLEFYRVPGTWRDVLSDTKALFESLSGRPLPFQEYSVAELFHRHTGIDLTRATETEALRREIEKRRVIVPSPGDEWADLFFKAWIERVETALPADVPVVVYDYPASLSPLSKSADGRVAERFEIYWHGMELCNGCTELDDVDELKRRYAKQSAERAALGKPSHPMPARLVEALESGFPACAGVAVGLDRLHACVESPPRQH